MAVHDDDYEREALVEQGKSMKRYLLFMGSRYYPEGGWNDLVGSGDDLEKVKEVRKAKMSDYCYPWWQIIDTVENHIVEEQESGEP